MSDRIVSREEFISAVGVNGNPVQMAQRSALLINHDRALRAERDNWKTIAFGHLERAQQAEAKTLDDAVALANQVNTERNKALQNLMQLEQDWIRERDALRADLLALAPLAKYALPLWEDCGPNERLRAILARGAREGGT